MTFENDAAEPLASRTFRGALFDMDGTLIDSTPAVIRSWTTLAEEWGATSTFDGGGHGRPARELLSTLLPADRVDEAVARVTELEIADTDGVVALPGAAELLAALPEHAWTIVTSCVLDLAEVRIAAAGIPRPDRFVTFDDVSHGKPHPEPFQVGAERLGLAASDCVAFEDAPAGLEAARAAGCFTIGVSGTHTADELDADVVLENLEPLRVELLSDGAFRLSLAYDTM